jgi:hypothetical protein
MASVIKSGAAITFPVTEGQGPLNTDSVTRSVSIGGVTVWEDPTKILWADAIADGVAFPAAASVITDAQAYATFSIHVLDAADAELAKLNYPVIIESDDLLRVLENSFGTWPELALLERNMVSLKFYKFATEEEQKAALINAYHNIADVHVDFCPPHRRGRWHNQSRMWDDTGVFESELEKIYSTRMLTQETWDRLPQSTKEKLMRAQLIEADFLLADMTPEKQRLAGLLSHSAGESAHFYRTVKPLELPVSRATALAMKGIISYVTRIAG